MSALNLRRGEIWYVKVFPYNDDAQGGGKRRPVVILGWSAQGPGEDSVVLTVPITAFHGAAKPRNGDVEIGGWQGAGLTEPSWIRARRLWGVDPVLIDRRRGRLGSISHDEMALVLVEIEALFAAI